MTLYEENLALIRNADFDLYQLIIADSQKKEDIEFCMESAKNGSTIIVARKNGEKIYLNSRYNPEHEADRFVMQYNDVKDYSYMLIFGMGNIMIVRKLLESLPEHITFLFYEPSVSVFRLMLEAYDMSIFYESSRVKFVVQDCSKNNIDITLGKSITIENCRMCIYNAIPVYKQLFPKEEKIFKRSCEFHLTSVESNMVTYAEIGKRLTYNNIYNLRKLFHCNCEEEFEGVFPTDRPAIIVSAGPSLEKNVECLHAAKGYFLIIAVDTALPCLTAHNILPDIVIIVDAVKPVQLFRDNRIHQLPFAISSDANYEVVECAKQKVIYISSESSYYNKIFQLGGKTMYQMPGGGSVSTYAFTLAVEWGYNKLILIGQDLAIAPDKVHAGNLDIGSSRLNEQWIEVDGYYGEKVYTLGDYNYFREWFETVIKGDDTLEVINATEGGARIEGTIQMPLNEVIKSYKVEPYDFVKKIQDMPPVFSADQHDSIVAMWKDSIVNLDTIKHGLLEGITLAKTGMNMISHEQYKNGQLTDIQQKIYNVIDNCEQMDEIYFVDAMTAGDEADILADINIAKEDAVEEVYRIFEKLHRYMDKMYSCIDEVKGMFAKIIEDAEELQAYE